MSWTRYAAHSMFWVLLSTRCRLVTLVKPQHHAKVRFTRNTETFRVMLAFATAAFALCEPWCENPCTDLNGAVANECSSCVSPFACRPGQPGFDTSRKNSQAANMQSHNPQVPADTSPADGRTRVNTPTEFVQDWQVGQCDLKRVPHDQVT